MAETDFIVQKRDLRHTRFTERSTQSLKAGEARLRIDAFAMTANNISYAVFADFAGYWNFFPTGSEDEGRVPFWGFATVTETTLEVLPTGTRVYGFLPASSDLVVQPAAFDPYGFTDAVVHRDGLPAFYNRYHLTKTDIAYDPAFEAIQMLVRPLYATGWLLDDMLMTQDVPPAEVIVSSASSKTALAYAHKAKDHEGVHLTGLTSERNADFVHSTGFFDTVVTYDNLSALPGTGPSMYCDFLGDPGLRPKLVDVLGEQLIANIAIGGTDWAAERDANAIAGQNLGPDTTFFFAPAHAEICAKRLGSSAFTKALNTDMRAFYPVAAGLIIPDHRQGQTAILSGWQEMLDAKVPPQTGLIFSP